MSNRTYTERVSRVKFRYILIVAATLFVVTLAVGGAFSLLAVAIPLSALLGYSSDGFARSLVARRFSLSSAIFALLGDGDDGVPLLPEARNDTKTDENTR